MPPAQITAHPAADDVSGAVPPGTPVVERTLNIDGDVAGTGNLDLPLGSVAITGTVDVNTIDILGGDLSTNQGATVAKLDISAATPSASASA